MAENEYLDSMKVGRWLATAQALRDGCEVDVVMNKFNAAYHKTVQEIFRKVPIATLIPLMDDPEKLKQRCDDIGVQPDLISLLVEAAHEPVNRAHKIEHFLIGIFFIHDDNVRNLAARQGGDVNVTDTRQKMEEVSKQMRPCISRLAKKLDKDPSHKPRKPRDPHRNNSSDDNTKVMLNQSLLIAGYRK